MVRIIEGQLIAHEQKIGIVASRFNELITNKLIGGALDGLKRHGIQDENIDIVWVPGAYEIPLIAQTLSRRDHYDAIICLGAVIRGSTPHFDYVASEVSKGIAQVALEAKKPVVFGVLTTDNIEQAIERAGTKSGNKGFDAAVTAIEMCNLMTQLNPKLAE